VRVLVATPPPVPLSVQEAIVRRTPQLAYVPARVPTGYRYLKWRWAQDAGALRVWFRSKAGKDIVFVSTWQYGKCAGGKDKTLQLAGAKVYWARLAEQQQAWRCVAPADVGGVAIQLTAATSQPPTKLPAASLGRVSASAQLIR
jgi:hypothetical protein